MKRDGAGTRNNLLDLCDPNAAQGLDGQEVDAANPKVVYADVWAEVKSVAGGERIWGLQIEANADHAVRILYREGVKPTMYFQPKGTTRRLEILRAPDPDGRRKELVCVCRELPEC